MNKGSVHFKQQHNLLDNPTAKAMLQPKRILRLTSVLKVFGLFALTSSLLMGVFFQVRPHAGVPDSRKQILSVGHTFEPQPKIAIDLSASQPLRPRGLSAPEIAGAAIDLVGKVLGDATTTQPVDLVSTSTLPSQQTTLLSTGDTQTIVDLIKQQLNSYLAQGMFKGDVGPSGPQGTAGSVASGTGTIDNGDGRITATIGNIPVVSYFPSNSAANFNGASLAGFTDLSSQHFTSDTIATKDLAVSGTVTFSGSLATGAISAPSLNVSGNVGIGTASPGAQLHLYSVSKTGTQLMLQNEDTGGKNWQFISSGTANANSAGNFYIRNANDNIYGLSITPAGNVGIGTTNPSARLSIYNDGAIANNGAEGLDVQAVQTLVHPSDQGDGAAFISHTIATTTATNQLAQRALAVRSQNNITGGGVLTNQRTLDLVQEVGATSTTTNLTSVFIEKSSISGGVVDNGYGVFIHSIQGTNKFGIYDQSGADEYFSGNVGIGTTTPYDDLTIIRPFEARASINGNENSLVGGVLTIRNNNSGASAGASLNFGSGLPGTGASYGAIKVRTGSSASDAGGMTFFVNGQGSGTVLDGDLTIANNHYVGIGTSTPTLGPLVMGSGAYVTAGGTWTNASDRNLKENFTQLDSATILQKINHLDISQWNYKKEDAGIKHIGPVAQDFYTAFHLGGSDTSISTIDPAGVALLGIQALSKKIASLQGNLGGNIPGSTNIFVGPVYLSEDSVGQAKILTNSTVVHIKFSKPYQYQPIVIMAPQDHAVIGFVSNQTADGFDINIEQPLAYDVTFNWHAFGGDGAKLTVSDGSTQNIMLVGVTAPIVSSASSDSFAFAANNDTSTLPSLLGASTSTPDSATAASTQAAIGNPDTALNTLVSDVQANTLPSSTQSTSQFQPLQPRGPALSDKPVVPVANGNAPVVATDFAILAGQ